jgi:hypothetical protein
MSDIQKQIDGIVAGIKADAYRQGWCDAMTALRKAALQVRYDCPILELPDGQGFAMLTGDPLLSRNPAPDAAPPGLGSSGAFVLRR